MTRALLERCRKHILGAVVYNQKQTDEKHDLIDALDAHLAQPQGEPVAWPEPALWSQKNKKGDYCKEQVLALLNHPTHTEAEVRKLMTYCVGVESGEASLAAFEAVAREILGVKA